jgi:DNA-binding MarR family transcriptional regulator
MKNTADSISELYLRPGFLLRRANQISASIFTEECGELLTPPQFTALLLISWLPGIDQMGVSRIMGFDRSTTALVITNLLKFKFIMRRKDEQDGRRYHLEITTLGKETLIAVETGAKKAHKRLTSLFTKEELKIFIDLLNRLVSGFNEVTRAPIDDSTLPLTHYRLQKKARSAAQKKTKAAGKS